jgi:beta-galactosidase
MTEPVTGIQVLDFESVSKFFSAFHDIKISQTTQKQSKKNLPRIAILASTSNFYLWHGEHKNNRNIHQDVLYSTYRLLQESGLFDVHVVGEKNLVNFDKEITMSDAVIVPHQVALPDEIRHALSKYWLSGGILIQDMRLGEFDSSGRPRNDWLHEIFGIRQIGWNQGRGEFYYNSTHLQLKPQPNLYTNYAMMVPEKGYQIRAKDIDNPNQGLILRGDRSLVFGFLPQLREGEQRLEWQRIFVDEIHQFFSSKTPLLAPNKRSPREY